MAEIEFLKYEGTGNDFILLDARKDGGLLDVAKAHARAWCDRHFGIGADGILVLTGDAGSVWMHIINADGTAARMCGNGLRCAANYIYHHDSGAGCEFVIGTDGGLQRVYVKSADGGGVVVDVMISRAVISGGVSVSHEGVDYEGVRVDVGNPHAVFEVADPSASLERSGAFVSRHPLFPGGANIEWIRELASDVIELEVYERGVGRTLACGTGCVAAAVAYCVRRNFGARTVEIHAAGGVLNVFVPQDRVGKCLLSGPSRYVFSGKIGL